MSELKATTIHDAYWKATINGDNSVLVYPKDEADKVIAELKADYKEACGRLQTANLIKDEQLVATCHQKFKRCLAMAKWCHSMWILLRDENETKKSVFYWRWWNLWYELAEKFKEAV